MLHKKVLLAAAPFDFESYLLYVEWEREPDKKFYVPRREVMHPVVQAMQDLIDDRLDLLTISMPPGTGKSTLGIFFLSWVMGRFPDSQSLASAHSGMLTRSFYDGVYQIITDSEYLWADVFPGVKLAATNSKEETIDLHKKHRFSTLTCRAINASLTGATRCDKILYADDLCSGIEEAMSKERLDKLWSAYTNDLKSRKKEGAKEIHIATRWSVHDVIGRLENQYGGDSRAKFIVLPALDADGESNFNYTYGVGFSRNYFEDMRNNLDEASFKAQEMTDPMLVPVGTRHMGTDMFNTVNSDVYGEFKKATMVVPTAKIDFAAFVDAVANLNIESTDNQPEKVAPQTFAFVHPGDTAELRKNLAEDLKYVEAFARAGYIGTVGGVNIYTKKDATKGTIVVATRQAVTIFNKKGVEVETDRDGDIRQNTIWSRKYYLAALTDATKAVKIFKGTATATADTTVSEGKVYYAKTDNGYIVGKPKTNPKTEGFYEIA